MSRYNPFAYKWPKIDIEPAVDTAKYFYNPLWVYTIGYDTAKLAWEQDLIQETVKETETYQYSEKEILDFKEWSEQSMDTIPEVISGGVEFGKEVIMLGVLAYALTR